MSLATRAHERFIAETSAWFALVLVVKNWSSRAHHSASTYSPVRPVTAMNLSISTSLKLTHDGTLFACPFARRTAMPPPAMISWTDPHWEPSSLRGSAVLLFALRKENELS